MSMYHRSLNGEGKTPLMDFPVQCLSPKNRKGREESGMHSIGKTAMFSWMQ